MENELMSLQVVSERLIREAAQAAESLEPYEKHNSFIYALETGKIYKDNNLSPVYLLDHHRMAIYVTSKQRLEKKFH
jgi:hypothetical protein